MPQSPHHLTRSGLSRPDGVGQLAHKLQLGNHVVAVDGVAKMMACEPALRAHADSLQCLLPCLAGALSHEVGGLEDALTHHLQVLQFGELARDDAEDHVLVRWQLRERLEPAGSIGVVF